MATEVASLTALLSLDDSGFQRGMQNAENSINNFGDRAGGLRSAISGIGDNFRSAGQSIATFGAQATVAMLPVSVGLGYSINMASNFESAFAGVRKTVDGTEEEFAALEAQIRDMATNRDNPLSGLDNAHVAIAQIVELGGQLGVATEDLDEFAQVVGELDIATDLDAERAALDLARLSNITGMTSDEYDNFGATLVGLGNNFAARESEIMEFTNRIGLAGTQIGLSEDEILGFSTAMAEVGLTAELGGTNFSKFTNDIAVFSARGGRELDRIADIAGVTADEFQQSFEEDAAGALELLLSGLGDLSLSDANQYLDELGFTGGEVQRVIMSLANDTDRLNQILEVASQEWNSASAATEEAQKRNETFAAQMAALRNNLNELAIDVGEALLPTLNNIIAGIFPIIDQISEWTAANPGLTQQIVMLGGAIAVLGPILSVVGLAISGIGVVLGALVSPIGLIIAAVGLLAAAFVTDFGGIRTYFEANILPWFGGLWDSIQEGGIGGAGNYLNDTIVQPLISGFQSLISGGDVWEQAKAFGASVLDAIQYGITAYIEFVTWVWENIGQPIANAITDYIGSGQLWDDLVALGAMFLDALAWGITAYIDIITWVWQNVGKPIADAIFAYIGSGQLYDDLVALGAMFLDAIAFGITSLIDITTWVWNNIGSPIASTIMSYVGSGQLWNDLLTFGGSILDAIAEGIGNIGQWAYDNIVQPIIDQVSSIDIGGMLSGLNPFGGGRADGGPVTGGTPYIVGERGPELFVPNSSGAIIPNEAMGARVRIDSVVINAPTGDGADIARAFEVELNELMRSRG